MSQWTVKAVLDWTSDFFKQKGITNPRLNAEQLIAHTLNLTRLQVYLHWERPLTPDERALIRGYVQRRAKNEPLQYIIGYTEFYDCHLNLTTDVLIPRPETERLCELLVSQHSTQTGLKVVDVGTGSGAIAIALAKHLPNPTVSAVDISPKALAVAKANAELNQVAVCFSQGDLLDGASQKWDLVVSNPPYIPDYEYNQLEPEVKDWEPKNALLADDNGLACYKRLLQLATNCLAPSGSIWLECGYNQAATIASLAQEQGFANTQILKDYNEIERFLWIRP